MRCRSPWTFCWLLWLCLGVSWETLAEDPPSTGGGSGAPRTTYILFEGTAQGGEVSIQSVSDRGRAYSAKTQLGETAEQVVAKLADAKDGEFLDERVPEGNALRVSAMVLRLYCRSTDPGIPTPPAVRNLQARPDAVRKVVAVTWENPDPSPSKVVIYRAGRAVGFQSGAGAAIEDSVSEGPTTQPKELQYVAVAMYEKTVNGNTCYRFSDAVVSETVSNPKYDPSDVAPAIQGELPLHAKLDAQFSYQMKDFRADASLFTWAVDSGTLPPGVTLTEKGLLSGTPTTVGKYELEVRAVDAKGRRDRAHFTLIVE